MRNRNSLTHAIEDMFTPIVADGYSEPDWMKDVGQRFAPTQFDLVKDDPRNFSDTWDFEVDGSSFIPLSDAAKARVFSKLPDGLTLRWDAKTNEFGYDVGKVWIARIVQCASKDKLISEDDYRSAQEELQTQWERR